MQLFLRLMAVLLVLATGGVFQTLAFASDEHAVCEDDERGGCETCASDCALCLCCPLRAAPASPRVEAPMSAPALPSVPCIVDEPVLSRVGADIFQPPRA